MICVILAAALSLLLPSDTVAEAGGALGPDAVPEAEAEELECINDALRGWLQAATDGAPYLLVDVQQGRVQLHQGGALLRDCPMVREHLGMTPSVCQMLERRIRRYRRSDSLTEPQLSAFDWEDYLAVAANPDCALHFSEGLLIYASQEWGEPRAPSLRVSEDDLMALYDALAEGTALVVLPPGWGAGKRGTAMPKPESGAR